MLNLQAASCLNCDLLLVLDLLQVANTVTEEQLKSLEDEFFNSTKAPEPPAPEAAAEE